MKKTLRLVLDFLCAALSVTALLAYAVMPFDVLPAPLWLSLFAMLPVLPALAIVWLALTAKAYIARRHSIGQAAI